VAIRLPPGDLYAELGVPPTATRDEISAAFRDRARSLHPDANPDPVATAQFQRLSIAYRVLVDPDARARYDAGRSREPLAGHSPAPPTAPATMSPDEPPDERARPAGRLGLRLTRRGARWLVVSGVALLALSIAIGLWALLDPARNDPDHTGRVITLAIVSTKLLVGGIVAVVIGTRRLRRAG
jgi:hypothetical protein